MLVLARRPNEKLILGNAIVVTVLSIRRRHVKLGITAPENVPIYREEVLGSSAKEDRTRRRRPRNRESV